MPDLPYEPTEAQLREAWRELSVVISHQASDQIKFILIGARLKLEVLAHDRGVDLWK